MRDTKTISDLYANSDMCLDKMADIASSRKENPHPWDQHDMVSSLTELWDNSLIASSTENTLNPRARKAEKKFYQGLQIFLDAGMDVYDFKQVLYETDNLPDNVKRFVLEPQTKREKVFKSLLSYAKNSSEENYVLAGSSILGAMVVLETLPVMKRYSRMEKNMDKIVALQLKP